MPPSPSIVKNRNGKHNEKETNHNGLNARYELLYKVVGLRVWKQRTNPKDTNKEHNE